MGVLARKLLAPSGGVSYATIEFVGGKILGFSGGTTDSTMALNSGLTGGIASSVSNGDFVLAFYAFATNTDKNDTQIRNGATPYTYVTYGVSTEADGSTADCQLQSAYKFVSGDTDTTFEATNNTSVAGVTAVYVFRNVDPTTPIDVSSIIALNTASVLAAPGAITPVTPGAFIVCAAAGGHRRTDPVNYTSSDLTDFISDNGSDTLDVVMGVGHKPDWTSGAFTPAAFGFSDADAASYSSSAVTIALRPAPL